MSSSASARAPVDRGLNGKDPLGSYCSSRLACLGLLALLLGQPAHAIAAGQDPTYENPIHVKAAFIRNFARYVKWPTAAFDKAGVPWRIGVLGSPAFGELLEKTLKGRSEKDRAFEIHSANSVEDLPPCQIVFIAFQDAVKRRAALKALKSKPVLTVGDADELLREGGIIRFQTSDRIQMSVNLDQARSVSLTIPAEMLEVSTEVLENGVIRRLR
jgi:hypothetical protein